MNQKINIAPAVFEYMEKVAGTDGVEVRVNLPKSVTYLQKCRMWWLTICTCLLHRYMV